MKKTATLGALCLLLCSAGTHAQTSPAPAPPPASPAPASPPVSPAPAPPPVSPAPEAPAQKPTTLKLGAFFPSNGDLKNAVGSTFFSVGAEYAFPSKANASALVPLAYLDYAGRSKSRSVNDGQGNSVSATLTASTIGIGGGVRYYLGTPGTGSTSPYLGAGLGVYFDHLKADANVSSGGQSGSGSSSLNKTQLGFRLNAGVEFQQKYLVEINYTNAGSVEGTRIDGFGLQAGVRF